MPKTEEHVALACHNLDVLAYLALRPEFSDWMVTVAFYAALHAVEAVLWHKEKKHGQSHDRRESILKHNRTYEKIWRHYRKLKSLSLIARYANDRPDSKAILFSDYLPQVSAVEKVIRQNLAPLWTAVSRHLPAGEATILNRAMNTLLQSKSGGRVGSR
ncbi:MAG TPA: hypothetical protein ENN87_16960 [Phycisphaerales bacterium]|nr:hypothetical protein [Phycisphaerales bacterium]